MPFFGGGHPPAATPSELGKATVAPRVLVVDDEQDTLDLCTRLLGKTYDVVTAMSAEEGMARLRESSCCLVIADQSLPGTSGIDFMSELQNRDPNIGRIIITGFVSEEKVLAAINRGRVHAFVVKPWDPGEFQQVVAREAMVAQLRINLADERDRYHRLVYDQACELPSRQLIGDRIERALRKDGFLGLLVVDAAELWAAQSEFGAEIFTGLRNHFVDALKQMQGKHYRHDDVLTVDETGSSRFCIFLAQPRSERTSSAADVEAIARRLQPHITAAVLRLPLPALEWWPRVAVGHGFVLNNANLSAEYQIREAVHQARDNARRGLDSDDQTTGKAQLEQIIVERLLSTVFQPIIDLSQGLAIGYEALSRGPAGSDFEPPLLLLRVADHAGLSLELDRAFRTVALLNASRLPNTCKLFINVLPKTLADPEMNADGVAETLRHFGIAPGRLVVEMSERYAVHHPEALVHTLTAYRNLGVQVALDDVGVGYSGVERIASLRPNYLKLDLALVRGIDAEPVKQSAVRALAKMAEDVGAAVIGEGIETGEELNCLKNLGVSLGQGFLLGRPAPWENGVEVVR